MNNSFRLQRISKPDILDSNLTSSQYKLNLLAEFMQGKFKNPKLKQSEIADQLNYSSSTLQRYWNDINMLSPYRIQPNINNKRSKKVSNTNIDNNLHCKHDLKRSQLTSNDPVKGNANTETIIERTSNKKNKTILKTGSVHENFEINEHYLDEILHKNDL